MKYVGLKYYVLKLVGIVPWNNIILPCRSSKYCAYSHKNITGIPVSPQKWCAKPTDYDVIWTVTCSLVSVENLAVSIHASVLVSVLVLPWLLYSWLIFGSHAHHLQSLLQQCLPVMEDWKFTVIKLMGSCNLSFVWFEKCWLSDVYARGCSELSIMEERLYMAIHVCHNWNMVERHICYCYLEYQEEMDLNTCVMSWSIPFKIPGSNIM